MKNPWAFWVQIAVIPGVMLVVIGLALFTNLFGTDSLVSAMTTTFFAVALAVMQAFLVLLMGRKAARLSSDLASLAEKYVKPATEQAESSEKAVKHLSKVLK